MKRFLTLFMGLSLSLNYTFAQTSNDTANYPYWIRMMQDPSVNFFQTQNAFNRYWQNRVIEKGSGWKAFKRWEWYSSKIVDSAGNFPAYDMQYQDLQDKIERDNKLWDVLVPGLGPGTTACKTQGDWKPIGPTFIPTNNTGQINGMGRVNSVALHPTDSNTIYVGAAAGGIWKTTNGGLTWSVNTDSLPTLGVSAIAIDPNNPSTMYFGSGDRDNGDAAGYGVFKSTNAGASWTISNSGMGNRTVGKLIIDPNNTSVLIAACNGGIYRSTNAGATWTQTFSGGFFKDIVFKPNNSNVVYATKDGLIYRSVNNGQSWSALSSGLPTSSVSRAVLAVSNINPSLLYVWIANGSVHRGFYLSRDSGTSFRTQSTTPNIHDYSTTGSGSGGQAWYNMDMVVDPGNQAVVYCGGVNVFRSDDTGRTWTIAGYWVNQIHADQHELVASPLTNRIYAGNDGGLYASRNRGASWTPLKSGLGIAQIYKMDAARNKKDILITGFQDNGTGNYNEGWFTTYGGDGMDCAIDQTDPRYSYGELYYGSVFRVFNVNAQASIAYNGYIAAGSDTINESGAWVTPLALREGNGTTMYIGYKNIWRSTNIRSNPVQWRKISNNLGGTNGSNFTEIESNIANSDILYASRYNGTLYRSDNVNASSPTWTSLSQPVAGVVNAIETDPKNQNVVYIGIGQRVYRSTNKGGSWTQLNSTFSHNVSSILLDTSNPKKGIYVGTYGGGVWYSDTTLSSWRYFTKGLPNTVSVTDLKMYYEPTKDCKCNVLYGSTYNRGTWFTTIYHDGTQKPVAKLNTYDTVICRSNSLSFKDKSCYNPTRFKWAFTPSVTFANGTDSSSQNPTINFASSGKYVYKFMVENCIGIDTMTGVVIAADTVKAACTPGTTNNISGLGIFYVELAGMNRTSSGRNPEGAYINLACSKVVKLQKGKKYLLKVTTGSTYTEQVKAFIDFNDNGSLSDAGELVYQPAANIGNHADTIFIPNTATTGKILRLRIKSDYISVGTNPCSNLSYGQTEDYGVYIETDPVKPKFVTNVSTICQGNSVTFTDSTIGVGAAYSWNFGAGASPSVATSKGPHTVTYSTPGYKKIVLTVDGVTYTKDSAVRVNAAPNISIAFTQGDSSVCRLRSFILKANDANTSNANYQWYLNGAVKTDSTFMSYRVSSAAFSDSGRYAVIASAGACKDTASQYVRVRTLPVSQFNINDSTQCKTGNLFSFTNASTISSGTYTNKWYFGNSVTDTGYSKSYSYPTFGTYLVKLKSTSNFACVDSVIKRVYVYENAVPGFTVNNSIQCYKFNSFLFTNTTSLSTGTYNNSWSFGDGSFSSLANPPSKHYNSFVSAYKVKLRVSTNNNCIDSIEQTVNLQASPVPGFSVNDSDQCLRGNGFAFVGNGSLSSGTYNSNWRFGDGGVSALNSPTHAYTSAGTFVVSQILISNLGCRDTLSKTVKVYEMPKAAFTINDSTQCLKANQISVNETGSIAAGTYSRLWLLGNGNTSTNKSETFSYLKDSSYSITLKLFSNHGCRDSLTKPVFIYPQSQTSFVINKATQCFNGHNFVFTNSSGIKSGTINASWSFGDLTSSSLYNPPAKSYSGFQDSFLVNLYINSNHSCKDTTSQWVKLLSSPYAVFSVSDSALCLNQNAFNFTNSSTSNKGVLTSQWSFGDNTQSILSSPSHRYNAEGIYIVKLVTTSSGICKDSASRTIRVWASPVAVIALNDSSQCLNENRFIATGSSQINTGSVSEFVDFGDGFQSALPAAPHVYASKGNYLISLWVNSDMNCKDTTSLNISVYESPKAHFIVNDSVQCLNENRFILSDNSTSGTPLTYQWSADNININSTSNLSQHSFLSAGNHSFSLVVKNSDLCSDTAYRQVLVELSPVFELQGDSSICVHDKLNLQAFPSTYVYDWFFRQITLNNSNQFTDSADVDGIFNVSVIAKASNGCNDTMLQKVVFNQLPVPEIGSFKNLSPDGLFLEMTFLDNTPGNIISRRWLFSDGNSDTAEKVALFFNDSVTLTTKLIVKDENGCEGEVSIKEFLTLPNQYFLPNSITPNGDQINDEFKLVGFVNFKSYSLKVYNRWGEMMFNSIDPKQGWNGTFMGEIVPMGSYIYIMEFEDWTGKKVELKGFVSILR